MALQKEKKMESKYEIRQICNRNNKEGNKDDKNRSVL